MTSVIAICIGAMSGCAGTMGLGPVVEHRGLVALGDLGGQPDQGAMPLACAWVCFKPCRNSIRSGVWRCVTGFLGALTTFSSFSAEVVAMLQASRYALALFTAVLHLAGSLILTVLGLKTVSMVMQAS